MGGGDPLANDPLAEVPGYRRLAELRDELDNGRAELTSELNELATPVLETAYREVLAGFDRQEQAAARAPKLQNDVAQIGSQAMRGMIQLDLLRSHMDEQKLKEAETDHRDIRLDLQARLSAAASFFERYPASTEASDAFLELRARIGGVAAAGAAEPASVQPIPAAAAPAAAPEKPPAPTPVTLTFLEDGLKIGRRGKIVRYNPLSAGEHDFTYAKQQAMRVLVNNPQPDKTLSPHELWAGIYPDGREYDPAVMRPIRRWLTADNTDVTFQGRRIFTHNGHRGFSSRYGVSSVFRPTIVESDGSQPPEPGAVPPVPASPAAEFNDEEAWPPPAEGHDSAEHAPAGEPKLAHLERGDLYVLALHLHGLNDVLADYERPQASDAVVKSLESHKPDHAHLSDEEREQYRRTSLGLVQTVFDDENKLMELIDSMIAGATETEFIECIFTELETPDGRELLSRLIASHWRSDITLFKGVPEKIGRVLTDGDGQPIWPIGVEKKSNGAAQLPTERREDHRRRQQIDKVVDRARVLLDRFAAEFDLDSSYNMDAINVAHSGFRKAVMNTGAGRKHVRPGAVNSYHGRAKFGAAEFLKISLVAHPEVGSIVKTNGNGKIIDHVIQRMIQEKARQL